MRSLSALLASALALATTNVARAGDDASKLLDGVKTVARPGIPGPVAVFGEKAFAVVTGANGGARASAIACGRLGSGRVVLFGHNGYGNASVGSTGETKLLLSNLLAWAAKSRAKKLRVGALGDTFTSTFEDLGCEVVKLARGARPSGADKLDVIGCSPLSLSEEEAAWLGSYVSGGGALFGGDTPWGWKQLNPGKTIEGRPGQALVARAGLAYADGTLGSTAPGECFDALPPSELVNALHAFDALRALDAGKTTLSETDANQATASLQLALRWMPDGDFDLASVLEREVRLREQELVPTAKAPVRRSDVLKRALIAVQGSQLERAEPAKVKAHPAAQDFPGDVSATSVVEALEIDSSVPGWHSTGLYARPGARVEVQLPSDSVERGFALRIGAHTDRLWGLDVWKRFPSISTRLPLAGKSTLAAGAFGGLVYIDVPDGCTLGRVRLQVRGAIPAPHFVLGTTSPGDWKGSIRARPAPWAELESSKLVITLPSSAVRELDDPTAIMEFWDRILDAQAELVGLPTARPRPERFVCDRQISAGYMHSGYPIMTHLDAAEHVVDLARLERGENLWGFVHELGHNLQRPDWTFEGCGEVTNNVIALYAIEQVCHLPEGKRGHEAVENPPSIAAYVQRGAKFDEWKGNPFLALEMYTELAQAFGWEPYKAVFAEYRRLGANDRPRTDEEKRDQWLVRMSNAVQRDLGPYFEAWGVPTSEQARRSVETLPDWMPDDFPTKD